MNSSSINYFGTLTGSKELVASLTLSSPDTYQFEVRGRSSFRAILSSAVGNANLKLSKTGSTLEFTSNNPNQITDGITQILEPGTYTLTVSTPDANASYALSLLAGTDISSSILWRNSSSDQTAFWTLNRKSILDGAFVSNAPNLGSNSDWKLVGGVALPETSGNRKLVWRNAVSDETAVWTVDANNKLIDGAFLKNAPKVGTNWQLLDANLVNGEMRLLWRNAISDETGYWRIDSNQTLVGGGLFTNTASLGSNSDWKLMDELVLQDKTQLIWRNAVSDETAYWTMNATGALVDAGFFEAPKVGTEWELSEVAQLSHDPLMVWRNRVTNELAAWVFEGAKLASGTLIDAPKVGKDWQIASVVSRYAEPVPLSLGGSSLNTALDMGVPSQDATFTDIVLPNQSNFYTFTLAEPQFLDLTLEAQGLGKQILNAEGKTFTLESSQPLGTGQYYFQVTNPSTTPTTTTLKLFFNTAPTLNADTSLASILEQTTSSSTLDGETISTLLSGKFSDADIGSSLKGIAIVGNPAPVSQGKWEYSADGRSWASVGVVSESQALILGTTAKLRFVPAAFYNGTPEGLTIRAVDNTYMGGFSTIADVSRNGGTSPFSGMTKSISTSVLPVNQAPTFTLGQNLLMSMNAGKQTVAGFLTNVAPGPENESSQTLTYEVTVDQPELFAASGQPAINPATGALTYTPGGTVGTANVTVTVKDDGGTANGGSDTTTKTFTITLTSVPFLKQFGTSKFETITGIAVDSTGDVYVAGYTNGVFRGNTNAGLYDAFLAKYDSVGNQLWIKQFGTEQTEFARGVAVDNTGNVYVVGDTDGAFSGYTNAGFGSDVFLAKYDSTGNQLGIEQFGTEKLDFATGVAVDKIGNVYLAGYTIGAFSGYINAGTDAFLAKFDSTGQLTVSQFGTADGDSATGVAVDSAGNVYLAGGTGGAFSGNTNAGGRDAFLAKFDSTGQLTVSQFGTADGDFATSVAVDSMGNVYLAGYTSGTFSGYTNAGIADGFLARFDSTGQLTVSQFGTTEDDYAKSIAVDSTGSGYIVGLTTGAFSGYTNAGIVDGFLARFDSTGQLTVSQFGTTGFDSANAVAVDGTGNFYLAGETDGSLSGYIKAGSSDGFIRKIPNGVLLPPE